MHFSANGSGLRSKELPNAPAALVECGSVSHTTEAPEAREAAERDDERSRCGNVTRPFVISNATAADYPAFVRLFPELAVPDPLPSAQRFAEVIAPQAVFAREGGAIVGYASSRPRGDRLHVVHVITDPAHRRRGVGRALMQELSQRARVAGLRRWMLNVKPDNVAALRLYAECGLQIALECVQLRLAWTDVAKLPSPPVGTATAILAPSDDRRVEDALGLGPGDLSSCRVSPGRVFLGASADGVPVACVAFDPAFPGAPVLRARSPWHARALLDGLLPHALPQHQGLFVFLEGDPALESALVGVGAELTMRVLRMEGDIGPSTLEEGTLAQTLSTKPDDPRSGDGEITEPPRRGRR